MKLTVAISYLKIYAHKKQFDSDTGKRMDLSEDERDFIKAVKTAIRAIEACQKIDKEHYFLCGFFSGMEWTDKREDILVRHMNRIRDFLRDTQIEDEDEDEGEDEE